MKVVLISLDALFDQDLPLMRQQPFFGEFLAHASGCTHVRTVYPALTYPAHTTLVTGVDPRQHGIGHNQPHHPELEASMRPWYWDRAQVKVPNLFDAVKEAGGSCASVLWPVTGKTKSIRWNFPEVLALPGENQTWKMLRYGSPLWLLQMEASPPLGAGFPAGALPERLCHHPPQGRHRQPRAGSLRRAPGGPGRHAPPPRRVQPGNPQGHPAPGPPGGGDLGDHAAHPGMEGAALCLVSDHGQADVRETVSLGEALTRLGWVPCSPCRATVSARTCSSGKRRRRPPTWGSWTDFLRQHMEELRASAVYSAEDLAAMGAVEGVSLAVEAAPGVVYDDGSPRPSGKRPPTASVRGTRRKTASSPCGARASGKAYGYPTCPCGTWPPPWRASWG